MRNRWGGTTGKMKGRGKRGEGTLSLSLSLSIVVFSIPLFLLIVSDLPSLEYLLRGPLCLDVLSCLSTTPAVLHSAEAAAVFFPAGAVGAALSATVASTAVVVATFVAVATAVSSVAAVAEVVFCWCCCLSVSVVESAGAVF